MTRSSGYKEEPKRWSMWRLRSKDISSSPGSLESMKNDQINATKQKHNFSSEDQMENSKEFSCSDFEGIEEHLSKGSSSNNTSQEEQLTSESQQMMHEEIIFNFAEVFKKGLLAALLASDDEEDVYPNEVLFTATDSSRDDQGVTVTDANFDFPKKEVQEIHVGSFSERKLDIDPDVEVFQSPDCIELYNSIVEGRDGRRSQSKFIPWFIIDKATCNVQPGVSSSSFQKNDQINNKIGESSTMILMNENTISEGLSKEQTLHGLRAPVRGAMKTDYSEYNRSRTFTGSGSFSYMSSQNSHPHVEPQLDKRKGKQVMDESNSFPYMCSQNFHQSFEPQLDRRNGKQAFESNSFAYMSSQNSHHSLQDQLNRSNGNQAFGRSSTPNMSSQNIHHPPLQAKLNTSNGNQVSESSPISYMSSQNYYHSHDPQPYKLYRDPITGTSSIPYMSNQNFQLSPLGELHGNHIGSASGAVSQSIHRPNINPPVNQIEETNSNSHFGINLPNENNLITFDETYISNTTPFNNSSQRVASCSNNMLAPETLQQYLDWQTWLLQQSHMNSQPTFTNILDPRVYSPMFQNALIAYHQNPHNTTPNAHLFTQLTTQPRRFEPSIHQFDSLGMESAVRLSLYPVPPQHVMQPQAHQILPFQSEQVQSVHLPVNYQNHADAGNIGTFRVQEVNMDQLSQLLQIMQTKLGPPTNVTTEAAHGLPNRN